MTDDDALTPEQIEGLNLDAPVRRAQFIGHLNLVNTAWEFLNTAVRDGDLAAAWGLVHESLRMELAQKWVADNRPAIRANGFDEGEVVAGLAANPPTHELWMHFERVHVRSLRQQLPESENWVIGAEPRIVGPDLEAVYLHDKQLLPDGVWHPGQLSDVCPLTFQRIGDQWLLAIIGANELHDDL